MVSVEKQTRLAGDLANNGRALKHMVSLCFDADNMTKLEEIVFALCKKRGVVKEAIAGMLQLIMEWISTLRTNISSASDKEQMLRLINTVRTASEGKIYVEVERARVTRILADVLEKDGDVVKAAEVIQEVMVETFGSLDKREKVDFILEQIRLSIAVKQYTKATVITRKLTKKTFENVDFEDMKLRFLDLSVQLALQEDKYMECSSHYLEIFNSPSVQADLQKSKAAIKLAVIFVVLSPHLGCEQLDRIQKLAKERLIENDPDLVLYRDLLRTFITKEIVRWPIVESVFGAELCAFPDLFGTSPQTTDEFCARHWRHLNQRVIEHNIRTIAGFYSAISLSRFSALLDMSPVDAEEKLCQLVSREKMVYAKIDRVAQVISFVPAQNPDEIMASWNGNVEAIMALLAKTGHQVAKEEMVHGVKA